MVPTGSASLLDGDQIFSTSINAPVSTWANTGWKSANYTTPALVAGSHKLEFCIDTRPERQATWSVRVAISGPQPRAPGVRG